MPTPRLALPMDAVRAFCEKWGVRELSLFGSVLREDFGPESDVDVLVDFAEGARWSLFDLVRMQDELAGVLGREVDLVDRRSVEASRNYIRRRHILESLEDVYVAGCG